MLPTGNAKTKYRAKEYVGYLNCVVKTFCTFIGSVRPLNSRRKGETMLLQI